MTKLTDKQNAFIEAYLGRALFNGTKAAIAAGYPEASARQVGSENLSKPDIAAEIKRRLSERAMSQEEVLDRLTAIARNDAAAYIKPEGVIDLQQMAEDGALHLVKGVKETTAGKVIELFDPQAALGTLAKHHGLLKETVEVSGPNGAPIAFEMQDALQRAYGNDKPTD